jgi:hypothetical protein
MKTSLLGATFYFAHDILLQIWQLFKTTETNDYEN